MPFKYETEYRGLYLILLSALVIASKSETKKKWEKQKEKETVRLSLRTLALEPSNKID